MQADQKYAELNELLSRLCDDNLERADWERLETLLFDDPDAQYYYSRFVALDVDLAWRGEERAGDSSSRPAAISLEQNGNDIEPSEEQDESDSPLPILSPLPTLSTTHYPLAASFVGGPVFSYMVATVVLCLMLLGSWAYKITHVENVVQRNGSRPANPSADPGYEIVGYVSGMKDCVWAKDSLITMVGASVSVGRKYTLESGLMEIAYASGAKVILEGPCEYTADSRDGGFLRVGKLVARVEKKVASGQWLVARKEGIEDRGEGRDELVASATSTKSLATNPRSLIPNPRPPLSALHSPLFTITTPTAVVTDLGTEFGVEVDRVGNTTSYVFQGIVRVETLFKQFRPGEEIAAQSVQLKAGEWAKVKRIENVPRLVKSENTEEPPLFARRLRKPLEYIDLLDIVAGGNGSGTRRERGIDPTTGMQDPLFIADYRGVENRFRPVVWHRLIDSVFVADGEYGAVRLDSAGHEYAGFPDTDGRVYGSIWSRAADIGAKRLTDRSQPWVYSMLEEEKFMPDRHGLLCFYANGGITFDLEAIRKQYPKLRPTRFLAVTGLGNYWYPDPTVPYGLADIWVFIDGRLKLKREQVRARDGAFEVNVELGPADRFLTLAATDGGNGISWDSVVFGDPRLELIPSDEIDTDAGNRPGDASNRKKEHSITKHSEAVPMEQ